MSWWHRILGRSIQVIAPVEGKDACPLDIPPPEDTYLTAMAWIGLGGDMGAVNPTRVFQERRRQRHLD